MAGGITFASNNFQTANIITQSIDHASIPTKVATLYPLAHANKSALPYINYPKKLIKIAGIVVGTSIVDLDSRLDTFRSYQNLQNQNLDLEYNGGTRRYTATVDSMAISRDDGLSYANFEIEFACTLPWGQDTSATTALNQSARTLNTYSDSYTFLGTAPFQAPVVTITLTAVSSTGSTTLIWGNGDNGQAITITRSNWTAGDVIVIDCANKTVTVNGIANNFTGAFPEFAPGARALQYTDSFTSRTMTELVTYTVRYL